MKRRVKRKVKMTRKLRRRLKRKTKKIIMEKVKREKTIIMKTTIKNSKRHSKQPKSRARPSKTSLKSSK